MKLPPHHLYRDPMETAGAVRGSSEETAALFRLFYSSKTRGSFVVADAKSLKSAKGLDRMEKEERTRWSEVEWPMYFVRCSTVTFNANKCLTSGEFGDRNESHLTNGFVC